MGKTLVIAEKPSVAGDIARAIGGMERKKDYFENDDFIISSAVGHLLELTCPSEYEVKRGKWTFPNLPVIPPHFDLSPIAKTEDRLKLLGKLCRKRDVERIVNACDAGREGELIFRYIVQYLKVKKPTQRLWLQSMTKGAIQKGLQQLREGEELQPLANAAVCRSESDWLVGINGTRAMTAFNSKSGGFHLTTVGRVQTPTLAIVVEREEKIKKFVPKDYWEVHATFKAAAGNYEGRWIDEGFKKSKDDVHKKAERIWDESRATAIKALCDGKPGSVTEESKPSSKAAAPLYDLTSLQRDANSRFGFSADRTLRLAQALYERHKVLTYPRTDARALPEDYPDTVRETLGKFAATSYETSAQAILDNNWVNPNNKRVFNNAKISDHFAIIPTGEKKALKDDEAKLYDMVVKRFLAVFHPAAEYRITTRITRVENEAFKTEGKVLVKAGWLAVYGKGAKSDDGNPDLTPVSPGETVNTEEINIEANQTKPPSRFSEATLLSAMEGAGKLVDDEELREAMSEKGLGTPATRASIIENLIREKYLFRQQRELIPTAKAFSIIILLRGLGVAELCSPELTGNWEHKLKQMEAGKLGREEFMHEIADITRRMVERAKEYESDTVPGDFGELKTPCPKCGGTVKENYKKFQCDACDWASWKIMGGRQFEISEMEELLTTRQVGPLQGFRNKKGFPFAAIIKLDNEHAVKFDFGNDDEDDKKDEVPDFSTMTPLGPCPKCQANVYEHGMSYICEKSVGPDKKCTFSTRTIILQKRIEPEQMIKMLTTKKTDLLQGFVSNRTGRAFSAFWTIDDKGECKFEFEERKPRKRPDKNAPRVKIDFTDKPKVGTCPRCQSTLFETEESYICEKSNEDTRPCKFKAGKVIAGHQLTKEELTELLEKDRTKQFTDFVSKAGRPFSARLVLEGGRAGKKVAFEFED